MASKPTLYRGRKTRRVEAHAGPFRRRAGCGSGQEAVWTHLAPPANPRHASHPGGPGSPHRNLAGGSRRPALGLVLRKLVCSSGSRKSRVLWAPPPRPLQVPGPQPPRRGLHDKHSPLFSTTPPALQPSSPPAAVTVPACKLLAGNKRLRSGRTRGASPPLSRRAARSHAAGWKCSGGGRISSPF